MSNNYCGKQGSGARWKDQVKEDVKESKERVCAYKRSAHGWIEKNRGQFFIR